MIKAEKVNSYFEDKRTSYSYNTIIEYLDSASEQNFTLAMGQSAYKLYFEHNNFLYLMDETKAEIGEYIKDFGWELIAIAIDHDTVHKNMSCVSIILEVK